MATRMVVKTEWTNDNNVTLKITNHIDAEYRIVTLTDNQPNGNKSISFKLDNDVISDVIASLEE